MNYISPYSSKYIYKIYEGSFILNILSCIWVVRCSHNTLYKIITLTITYMKVKVIQSCLTLWDSMDCIVHELYSPWNSPGQNTRVGSLSLLKGIFPIEGLNPGLPHCRWILYQLSYQGSLEKVIWWQSEVKVTQSCLTLCDPMDYTVHGNLLARILEWVAIPFSRGSSRPWDRTQVSRLAGEFFTSWATREAKLLMTSLSQILIRKRQVIK